MRRLLLACVLGCAVFVAGVTTSGAALQNALHVKVNFKKAGSAGSLSMQLVNINDAPLPEGRPVSDRGVRGMLYDGGLVPERIQRLIVQSSSIRYNRKALPYCKVIFNGQKKIPTRADGITGAEQLTYVPKKKNSSGVKKACPQKSILGSGTFTAAIGTPGLPYNPTNAGILTGSVIVYNHQPKKGDTLGAIVRISVNDPVPSNQYIYAGVSRGGKLVASIPSRAEIPLNLDASLPAGEVALTSISVKLKAPKVKKARRGRKAGKPIFTIKTFKDVRVYGQLVRG